MLVEYQLNQEALTLPWHFGSMPRNPSMAVRTTIRNRRWSEQLGDDGAADLRQRWLRRRSVAPHLFSPTRRLQAPVLQISKGDAGHQRVPMQASPGPALEVAEAELLLELLVHRSQDQRALTVATSRRSEVCRGRLLRWYFFSPLSRHSPISQSSSPGRRVPSALSGPSATRTRTAVKRALSGPLVPLRQVMRRQRRLSSISAAESGGRLGTGCLAGRPVGVYAGRSLTVVG